jgi:hypothetical protein
VSARDEEKRIRVMIPDVTCHFADSIHDHWLTMKHPGEKQSIAD